MATQGDLQAVLSPHCKLDIPSPGANLHDFVSRWSDSGVNLPYAVVTPSCIEDIQAFIKFASENNLKVIPTNGGHASFIPITSKTVLIDLSLFKSIDLDEENEEVSIGAGCVTGDVLKDLTSKGWYTLTANSNAVGMTGALLGGLSHSLNGVHGFGIDHVLSITIIPFSDFKPIVLTPGSDGEEKRLFNVICGAGHGLGVITSITLRAFRISTLSLTEDKVWTRRLIFPAPAIGVAAQLYVSLLPLPLELVATLVFLRAPPTAPKPGTPMIMLGLNYYGSTSAAEQACSESFSDQYVSKTISAVTALTTIDHLNDGVAPLNAHGQYKEYHSAFCKEVNLQNIEEAFQAWASFTSENLKERGRSYILIGSWSTTALLEAAGSTEEKFFPARDRGVFIQVVPWYTDVGDKSAADTFGKKAVGALREKDRAAGRRDRAFVNNLVEGQNMRDVYTEEQIREIGRVKGIWDKEGLGWSPVVNGW